LGGGGKRLRLVAGFGILVGMTGKNGISDTLKVKQDCVYERMLTWQTVALVTLVEDAEVPRRVLF
jgi:outer membrane PBP1 activator LpoA protein